MITIGSKFVALRSAVVCLAAVLLYSCQGQQPADPPSGIEGTGLTSGTPPPPPPSLKMTTTRASHTATLLQDGRVLIAGGTGGDAYRAGVEAPSLASAELYDPSSGTFTPTGDMTTARADHTAILLADGKVLIAGGIPQYGPGPGPFTFLVSAEIYDPSTGTFTATGNMVANGGFGWSTSALLPDGRVFIAANGNAEVYDPITGTFALTGPYIGSTGVVGMMTVTLLQDGKVLVVGGDTTPPLAELYDPKTDTFAPTSPPQATLGPRNSYNMITGSATTTLLVSGTVLFVDGNDSELPDEADIYDPASGKFTPIGFTHSGHEFATATRLPDGTVLIAGGQLGGGDGSTSVEVYDPATGKFSNAADLITGRHEHTATLLDDGTVLIAGGYSTWPNPTASAEIYK